jgi:hypothetical protein
MCSRVPEAAPGARGSRERRALCRAKTQVTRLLNWICLAGAMHALGRRAETVEWVETYVFNSSKCFAVFR